MVREFEDKPRGGDQARRRRTTTALARDGPKVRGQPLVADQRRARARPCRAQRRARPVATRRKRGQGAPGRASPERPAQGRRRHSTREEIKAIVGALQGRWRPIMLTAIFTGLRASELRGLRWADVDFAKEELHVRQRADRYNAIGEAEVGSRRAHRPVDADRLERPQGMEARLRPRATWTSCSDRAGERSSSCQLDRCARLSRFRSPRASR